MVEEAGSDPAHIRRVFLYTPPLNCCDDVCDFELNVRNLSGDAFEIESFFFELSDEAL